MNEQKLLNAIGGINPKYIADSESSHSATHKIKLFRTPRIAAAIIAACVCITGITALAASGTMTGFFKDIFSWNGAVVGTSYENATDEINVTADVTKDSILITMTVINPQAVPYSEFDTIRLKNFSIMDSSDNIVAKDQSTDTVLLTDGEAQILYPASDLPAGKYRLTISQFEGGKKADQPLPLNGEWVCEFTITR